MTQIDDIAPLIKLITAERIGGDSPLFEDAQQEALIAAWQRLEEGHPKGIAVYKARQAVIDVARGRRMTGSKAEERGKVDLGAQTQSIFRTSADGAEEYVHEPADHRSTDEMAQIDLGDALSRALETLPALDREMIQQRFYEGLTLTQIAEREGVSRQAIGKRMDRAFTHLRQHLS